MNREQNKADWFEKVRSSVRVQQDSLVETTGGFANMDETIQYLWQDDFYGRFETLADSLPYCHAEMIYYENHPIFKKERYIVRFAFKDLLYVIRFELGDDICSVSLLASEEDGFLSPTFTLPFNDYHYIRKVYAEICKAFQELPHIRLKLTVGSLQFRRDSQFDHNHLLYGF